MISLPGLIDAHVHLRTPGQTHKEDISTGTRAALAGGFTQVLDMPNTTPPTVDRVTLDRKLEAVRAAAHCAVHLFAGATEGNSQSVVGLAGRTVGLKLYLGQTHGPLFLPRLESVMSHLRHWPGVVAVHAEGWQLAAAIGLACIYGRPLHCCHISRRPELAIIRQAKDQGFRITCEVTPHHLTLIDADERAMGAWAYMKPALGTAQDRAALWENLDLFDCVASDHAPHTREEKRSANPPPGVPGLETTLPILLTAVHEGRLSMDRLVELMYTGPRSVYSLTEQPQAAIEIDPQARYTVGDEPLHTKCGWTPFAGLRVRGRVERVVLDGQPVYDRADPMIG